MDKDLLMPSIMNEHNLETSMIREQTIILLEPPELMNNEIEEREREIQTAELNELPEIE